jgi:DNA-binding CsgD family transcriptional regulator
MLEVVRQKLRVTEEQREFLLDLASRLEPYLPEIKKQFIKGYRKLDPQSNELVEAELKKLGDSYFSTFISDKKLEACYDRMAVSAERLHRMKVPFESLILSFHLLEESCHPYLEKAYPDKEELVRAIVTMDFMCHICFAAIAYPYLRYKSTEGIPGGPVAGNLTDRETEILRLVANGRRNREIAEILNLSIKTVEHHRSSMMRKLGIRTVAELVRYTIQHRLIRLAK